MKNNPPINLKKQEVIVRDKSMSPSRRSSRMSVLSNSRLSHRPSLITNARQRSSRSYSRGSISITNQPLRQMKTIQQTTNKDHQVEVIKNGIHIQFRLSKQDQFPKQPSTLRMNLFTSVRKVFILVVSFDVTKTTVKTQEELIVAMQNKCKQLLAQAKEKMFP